MPYFTTKQTYLFLSSDLPPEEKELLNQYLEILEESGVGKIIESIIKKDTNVGRKPYNPYKLFATIIYSFSKHSGSIRKIEESIKFDTRFIYLMEGKTPSYISINEFLNNVVVSHQKEIFTSIIKAIINRFKIDVSDCFIDGTKIEANSNKYLFVYKPTTPHIKLNNKILDLLSEYFHIPKYKTSFTSFEIASYITDFSDLLKNKGITLTNIKTGRGHKISKEIKDYKQLCVYLEKALEYEEKEKICGDDRNSYYKTDKDATAMCLKEDYYSGLGSNMHAAYNYQIIVSKGIILDYYVSQDRNDFKTLIPFLEEYYKNYGEYPKRLCADSGYGSKENYEYIFSKSIESYIKYPMWNKFINGEYQEQYSINSLNEVFCLNNKKAIEVPFSHERHQRYKGTKLYKITNCMWCRKKTQCLKNIKNKNIKERYFEIDIDFYKAKLISTNNLLSKKGIEMRVNRSSQVEGTFGIIKQDMGYTRARRRGLNKVNLEFMLTCLGLVLTKTFKLLCGKTSLDYWIAPPDLKEEKPKELTTKKILKKKKKGKNKTLRDSYKRKGSR